MMANGRGGFCGFSWPSPPALRGRGQGEGDFARGWTNPLSPCPLPPQSRGERVEENASSTAQDKAADIIAAAPDEGNSQSLLRSLRWGLGQLRHRVTLLPGQAAEDRFQVELCRVQLFGQLAPTQRRGRKP